MAKRAATLATPDPQAAVRARFMEHGTDPAIAKKALEDATGLSRGLWLSFLTFGTYLAITFAGVDHRDLFLETPIVLPVLNAGLPLVTFFWVAPLFFVIFHLYLLLSLKLLADQVHNYIGHMRDVGLDAEAQDRARLQLPNFVMVQVLGGTSGQINSWAGKLLSFTAFLTLVAGPLILLLFAQLMFLPYHGWWVTMAQRVLVVIDLVFICYFWRAILKSQIKSIRLIGSAASAVIAILSFVVFMYPSELLYNNLAKSVFEETNAPLSHFYGSKPTEVGLALFNNTLILPGEKLVEDQVYNTLESQNLNKGLSSFEGERSYKFLKDRDFSYANLRDIDLRKADFSRSILTSVWFEGASLEGATFYEASMQGASLNSSSLQGASFENADLQGASFEGASMQTTSFKSALLQGAYLAASNLQGANFTNANLQSASLYTSNAMVADFGQAEIRGTSLESSFLQGANFNFAIVSGAVLDSSKLWRARGSETEWFASIKRVDFAETNPLVRADNTSGKAANYESWITLALHGVPPSNLAKLKADFETLNPNISGPLDTLNRPKLVEHVESQPKFENLLYRKFTDYLIDAVCSAGGSPHIANGLGRRLDIYFLQGAPKKEIVRGLSSVLGNCPGTKHLNEEVHEKLKELFEEAKSNSGDGFGLPEGE